MSDEADVIPFSNTKTVLKANAFFMNRHTNYGMGMVLLCPLLYNALCELGVMEGAAFLTALFTFGFGVARMVVLAFAHVDA